ncbi:unnamed protein product [Diatraea saccharalis]|uniref:DUF7869 domain-containing protein n=1 Tax=Diatraea saccharalis TaxID=40085 RepID=A0A9N9WEY0_9NEOP|nr:unnamed protein product [Diatraea saccharalis]
MCENDKLKLCALLVRKEKLMNMKRIIQRSIKEKINSSESFIECSESEGEVPLITRSSENDVIRTSTISLPRLNLFFNKQDDNFSNINEDNHEKSFLYKSEALNIIQNEEPHANNIGIEAGSTSINSDSFVVSHAREICHKEVVENMQTLSPLLVLEIDASNSKITSMCDTIQEVRHPNEKDNIQDISLLNIDIDADASDLDTFVIPNNIELELNHTNKDENIQTLQHTTEPRLALDTCEVDIPENNIEVPQEQKKLCPEINEIEHEQQNIVLKPTITSQDVPLSSDENNNTKRTAKRQRLTSKFAKSCMDFYSEEENNDFSSGSSDLWSEKEISVDSDEENNQKRKRKKTKSKKLTKTTKLDRQIVPIKKRKPENKRETRKTLKEKGLAYATTSGKLKEARKLRGNPCKEQKCVRKCFEITEDRRKSLFDYFWALDDTKKRDWLVQCSRVIDIKRKKTKNIISRRSLSHEYFINEGEGRRQVCQQFILKTLDISQTYLLYTVNHATEGLSTHESRTRTAPDKYDENTKLDAKKYIETLPALPSHYSRKKSNKLYLPEQFKNLSNLYRLYVKHSERLSIKCLSEKMFSIMFREYNFAFHVPKKDKCSICTKNENNPDSTTNEQLQEHLMEKEATYKRLHIHRNLKSDQALVVASFDLQKVLATPHGESMMLYYSRKYAVYNFTVYECKTQNGYCYTWGEGDGKRGSCEIATCLTRYLKEVDNRGVKTLIFYCDNCTGQNKNRVILSLFKYFLQTSQNLQTIQINYLLPGHTYMPVDSMHAVIKREVKNLIIWAPSQWATFMETARKRPKPYSVEVLEHTDFINFNNLSDTIFTPATLKNKDLRMKQIRVCTFKKSALAHMQVKYTMHENGTTYNINLSRQMHEKGKGKGIGKRTNKGKQKKDSDKVNENKEGSRSSDDILSPLYRERLPISVAKYNDLKKLCETGIIPKRFHDEYLRLPNKAKVLDVLNDTDENDEDNDESYEPN